MPRATRFDLPAAEITPEPVYLARRRLMGAGLASPLLALGGCAEADEAPPVVAGPTDSPDGFRTTEPQTRFEHASSYNNFYEFGTGKEDPPRYAQLMKVSPWQVTVEGETDADGGGDGVGAVRQTQVEPLAGLFHRRRQPQALHEFTQSVLEQHRADFAQAGQVAHGDQCFSEHFL